MTSFTAIYFARPPSFNQSYYSTVTLSKLSLNQIKIETYLNCGDFDLQWFPESA